MLRARFLLSPVPEPRYVPRRAVHASQMFCWRGLGQAIGVGGKLKPQVVCIHVRRGMGLRVLHVPTLVFWGCRQLVGVGRGQGIPQG